MRKIISLVLCIPLLLCSCTSNVDYASVDLSKIEDAYNPEEGAWYIENTPKSWWKTSIDNYSNKQQIKLLNDICFFELPTDIELGENFSFFLNENHAFFTGSITATYDLYKQISVMLLENRHWNKETEKSILKSFLQSNRFNPDSYIFNLDSSDYDQITELINNKSDEIYNKFELYGKVMGPYKTPTYHRFEQHIMLVPNEEEKSCIIYIDGELENYTNKYGLIGDYYKDRMVIYENMYKTE